MLIDTTGALPLTGLERADFADFLEHQESVQRDVPVGEVYLADDGQAGIDSFRSANKRGRPFDVILTDLGMPHLDGRQVARIIKREQPATPILMLTGWGVFMQMDGDIMPGIDGVLSKPPRINEVREALARVTKNVPTVRASQPSSAIWQEPLWKRGATTLESNGG